MSVAFAVYVHCVAWGLSIVCSSVWIELPTASALQGCAVGRVIMVERNTDVGDLVAAWRLILLAMLVPDAFIWTVDWFNGRDKFAWFLDLVDLSWHGFMERSPYILQCWYEVTTGFWFRSRWWIIYLSNYPNCDVVLNFYSSCRWNWCYDALHWF